MNTRQHLLPAAGIALWTVLAAPAQVPPGMNPEMGPYLGVGVHALDPGMAPHVGLAPGFGLVVDFVDPDGAAAGTLRERDILHQVDDQRLTSPDHLAVLIRSFQPGDTVTLRAIRAGEHIETEVALIEREVGAFGGPIPRTPGVSILPPVMNPFNPDAFRPGPAQIPDELRRSITQELDKLRLQKDQLKNVQDAIRRAMEGARGSARTATSQMHSGSTVQANSRVQVMDRDGMKIILTAADGDERLHAVDKDGTVLFDGPVNTEEERAALPPGVAQLYGSMQGSPGHTMFFLPTHPEQPAPPTLPTPPPPPGTGSI